MTADGIRALVWLAMACVLTGTVAAGERFEKQLELESSLAEGGLLSVENLLGSITVHGGGDPGTIRIEGRAVIEAGDPVEARELADSIRLLPDVGSEGTTIHVAYPVERHTAFRLPRSEIDGLMSKWITPLVHKKTVAVQYGDRSVEVSQGRGAAAVAVHLEITVPFDVRSRFRQIVGSIGGAGLRGEMVLEIVEGSVLVEQVYGSLEARTGGGEIAITSFRGDRLAIQTGSGRVNVVDARAVEASLRTGSGAVVGREIVSDSLVLASDSGNIELTDVEPIRFDVDLGSGWLDLATKLKKTKEANIRSKSGDVTLRVGALSSFDILAEAGPKKVKTRGLEVEWTPEDVGEFRLVRGRQGAAMHIATQSGTVVVKQQ